MIFMMIWGAFVGVFLGVFGIYFPSWQFWVLAFILNILGMYLKNIEDSRNA